MKKRAFAKREDELEAARLRVADTIGALIEFWGFKRPMGRIWTLLYVAPEPRTAAELGDELSMSAGAVSMAISELAKWGVVKKTWRPGTRRDYFEAETDIWKLVSRVFRERELTMVREAGATFAAADRGLAASIAEMESGEPRAHLEFERTRIANLRALTAIAEALLASFVEGHVDADKLREFVGGKAAAGIDPSGPRRKR